MTSSRVTIGLIVLVTSCSTGGEPAPTGTVKGLVSAGPTCPVEVAGDPTCAPVPVAGSVEFLASDDVVASTVIDGDGRFVSTLEVGDYTLHVNVGEAPFPLCQDQQVTVIDSEAVTVNVDCDTGIRGPGS